MFVAVSSVVRIQKARKFGMGVLFFWWWGGGEGVNFCPAIFGGFVGNPRDFLGFDFCPHSIIECFEKRKGEDGKK